MIYQAIMVFVAYLMMCLAHERPSLDLEKEYLVMSYVFMKLQERGRAYRTSSE